MLGKAARRWDAATGAATLREEARRFDLALAHGSHELTLAARSLGIPSATTFDYEFAWLQHQLGCRAATRVVVPDAIPAERLARYGARPPKLRRYPGSRRSTTSPTSSPTRRCGALGVDPASVLVVVRTPPEVSLYHRHGNPLFRDVLERLGRDEPCTPSSSRARRSSAKAIRGLGLPSLHVPERAVDAQSLIAPRSSSSLPAGR